MGGWVTLFIFPAAIIYLYRKKEWPLTMAAVVSFALLLVSFFAGKMMQATNSVFFSGARMLLAYPFILMTIAVWCYVSFSPAAKRQALSIAISLALIAFCVKAKFLDGFLERDLRSSKYTVVAVTKIDDLERRCGSVARAAGSEAKLAIGTSSEGKAQLIAYGCPCLREKFPITLLSGYERRTWILPSVKDSVYSPVVYFGYNYYTARRMFRAFQKERRPGLFDNRLKTGQIIDSLLAAQQAGR
jgi:hypothetical protein